MLSWTKIALTGAPLALFSAPALASSFAVDLGRCPDYLEDLRDRFEDRIDSRVVTGRRDLIEDRRDRAENRRDERVTHCPASAVVYRGGGYGRGHGFGHGHGARPWAFSRGITLYKGRDGAFYHRTRSGRLTRVSTFGPRPAQIQRLRAQARREAALENRRGGPRHVRTYR